MRDEELPPRRRRVDGQTLGKRLAVNTSSLDFTKFAYRFINDAPARLFQKTQQDNWNLVTADGKEIKEDSTDLGAAISVVVGTKVDGSPMRSFLCRKPRKFYEEDEKTKAEDLDEQLSQLRRGNSAAGELQGDYATSGGIKIA